MARASAQFTLARTRAGEAAICYYTSGTTRDPKEVTSPPGDVSFVVKNTGAIEHNFVIEDQAQTRRGQIPIIEPGQTLVTQVTLPPGTYTIYCSEPGHREAGMVATLHVR
jgi:uncharacterized cupredoxin-like copper-binding protein